MYVIVNRFSTYRRVKEINYATINNTARNAIMRIQPPPPPPDHPYYFRRGDNPGSKIWMRSSLRIHVRPTRQIYINFYEGMTRHTVTTFRATCRLFRKVKPLLIPDCRAPQLNKSQRNYVPTLVKFHTIQHLVASMGNPGTYMD